MTWLPSSAVLLMLAIVAGVIVVLRRRARTHHRTLSSPHQRISESIATPTPTDPRVKQFRFTGSNRIIDPKLSAADLRNAAVAAAEQEDFKSENDTIVLQLTVRERCLFIWAYARLVSIDVRLRRSGFSQLADRLARCFSGPG